MIWINSHLKCQKMAENAIKSGGGGGGGTRGNAFNFTKSNVYSLV